MATQQPPHRQPGTPPQAVDGEGLHRVGAAAGAEAAAGTQQWRDKALVEANEADEDVHRPPRLSSHLGRGYHYGLAGCGLPAKGARVGAGPTGLSGSAAFGLPIVNHNTLQRDTNALCLDTAALG